MKENQNYSNKPNLANLIQKNIYSNKNKESNFNIYKLINETRMKKTWK